MERVDRLSLDRCDFIGFDWIFDMQGSLERMLDRIDRDDRSGLPENPPQGIVQ